MSPEDLEALSLLLDPTSLADHVLHHRDIFQVPGTISNPNTPTAPDTAFAVTGNYNSSTSLDIPVPSPATSPSIMTVGTALTGPSDVFDQIRNTLGEILFHQDINNRMLKEVIEAERNGPAHKMVMSQKLFNRTFTVGKILLQRIITLTKAAILGDTHCLWDGMNLPASTFRRIEMHANDAIVRVTYDHSHHGGNAIGVDDGTILSHLIFLC
jgi:hypothetical protein